MTTIYCYSGTGNTLRVAKIIAETMGDAIIVPFHVGIDERGDTVGFVFPVYYAGLPRLVSDFFAAYKPRPGVRFFGVATYGGAVMNALRDVNASLGIRGAHLRYAKGIRSVSNNIMLYDVDMKNAQSRAALADEAARAAARDIASGVMKKTGRPLPLVSRLAKYPERDSDRAFIVNRQACVQCGRCADICPRGNITLADAYPAWKGNCDQCLSCIQWCPKEAIDYGVRTVGRARYHHPDIDAGDLPR